MEVEVDRITLVASLHIVCRDDEIMKLDAPCTVCLARLNMPDVSADDIGPAFLMTNSGSI